jgi:addiction module HigA family antidote
MVNAQQSPGSFLALMLEKYRLNSFKLAQDIHLSPSAVRLITLGKTKITTSVAIRLAKYFNTNPEFWLAMQMKWDVAEASKDKALMKIVKNISRVTKGAASSGEKSASAKKPAAQKKTAKKTAAKKKTVKTKKPAAGRKVKAIKKPLAGKRTTTTKRPVTRKKAAAKKPVVKTGKKTTAARAKSAGRHRHSERK